ncbi:MULTISPECIES: hypothetical protein [Flavobacterium]|uniref:hypothetical protein n=1 Tax=Flavobacterium TaxID=237 RepID=UPI0011821B83|nr:MULTISPECIES: hypothetical protein [Flavobacterium]MCR4032529.1 hypothetical protein [Flavobacterium panacis]
MEFLDFINFEDPNSANGVIKASIHKTGKLGFSSGAKSFMDINEETYFKIGFNDRDANDTNIYMVPSIGNEGAFKVSKAGDYYYINLKHIFDKREIEYQNESNIYDIKKVSVENNYYFILSKRK